MKKECVRSIMPQQFKKQYPFTRVIIDGQYPFTRVIIDATEIYVEQPELPELQQMTFLNYKNDNTYKGLIGTLTQWCSYVPSYHHSALVPYLTKS